MDSTGMICMTSDPLEVELDECTCSPPCSEPHVAGTRSFDDTNSGSSLLPVSRDPRQPSTEAPAVGTYFGEVSSDPLLLSASVTSPAYPLAAALLSPKASGSFDTSSPPSLPRRRPLKLKVPESFRAQRAAALAMLDASSPSDLPRRRPLKLKIPESFLAQHAQTIPAGPTTPASSSATLSPSSSSTTMVSGGRTPDAASVLHSEPPSPKRHRTSETSIYECLLQLLDIEVDEVETNITTLRRKQRKLLQCRARLRGF